MEMLGFKEDMVTQDFLYKKKNEILADPKLSDIEKTSLLWYQNLMTNIARSEFPVVSDLAGSAVGYSSDIGDAYIRRIGGQYTFDAAKRLSDPNIKTGREYLVANGIPEEAYPYFMQSLADRAKSIAGAYAKNTAPGTGNNQVEGFYAWKFDPRKWNNTDSLIENLKDMRLKNPKLFNDTMAYIGQAGLAFDRKRMEGTGEDFGNLDIAKVSKKGKITPLDELGKITFTEIFKTMDDSTAQDDHAITDVFGDKPLQTSFTNTMKNSMGKFAEDVSVLGVEGAKKKLDQVEKLTKVIMTSTPRTNQYIDALALANFELKSGIQKMAKFFTLDEMKTRFPYIMDTMFEALSLRGEDVPRDVPPVESKVAGKGGGKGLSLKLA